MSASAGAVRVVVADDGPGVPPGLEDRIFDRFFQADAADDRRAEGAGIGLSLARELTELHGGTLTLAPGGARGATFELRLPTGSAHLAVSDIAMSASPFGPPAPLPAAEGADDACLLLVEDHAELRAYLQERLSEQCRVEAVADAPAALTRLREGGVSLLLFDIMLPGMDGLALCRAVRADPQLQTLPVILISARGPAAARDAAAAAATAFLSKPILGSALLAALRTYVAPRAVVADKPTLVSLSEDDRRWLARIEALARAELRHPTFSVEVLAARVGMSPRTLQRTLNRVAGKAPVAWLHEMRLDAGRERLRARRSVAEAADVAGLTTGYFSKAFASWYGYPPSKEPVRAVR